MYNYNVLKRYGEWTPRGQRRVKVPTSLRISTVGLVCLVLCLQSLESRNRGAARRAYQKAEEYHKRLTRTPESRRKRSQYRQAIFLHRRVVDYDPTYSACDDSLYAVATIYDEMGRRFESSDYQHKAIYYYEFVAREYPTTKHRSTALQRARILKNPPRSKHKEEEEERESQDVALVSEIRYRANQEYTRVVIQLDHEIKFKKDILSNPDRIYFDLQGTRLAADLQGRTYKIDDVFITRIRVAENRPDVVRVVLDFNRIHEHLVFALYNPFRIVIDISGDRLLASQQQRKPATANAVLPLTKTPKNDSNEAWGPQNPVVPTPNLHGDRSLTRVLGLKVGHVVLDPGHGGSDTGTIGPGGMTEKTLVLDVALRLKTLLEERLGTKVTLTRNRDQFVALEERTAIANQQKADLFISIHGNASQVRRVTGAETFFLNFASSASDREVASRENASSQRTIQELENLLHQITLGDYNAESKDLAHVVQKHLFSGIKKHRSGFRNRGVKTAPFIVLIGAKMPSILTEIGFLSNPSEEKFLKSKKGQKEVVESLYSGIEQYFRALGSIPLNERAERGRAF